MFSVRTFFSAQGHRERDQDDAQLRSSSESSPAQRRRHHCPRLGCGKSFSSPGHLRRHLPIHTGQKNHPCPFPGCRIKCSRQDNLQQHYKIHFKSDTLLRKTPTKPKITKIHDTTPSIIFGSGPSSAQLNDHDPSPFHPINSSTPLEEAHFPSAMLGLQDYNRSLSSLSMSSPPPFHKAQYSLRRVDCWPRMIVSDSTPIPQTAPLVLPATFVNQHNAKMESPRCAYTQFSLDLSRLKFPGIEDEKAIVDTLEVAYAESHYSPLKYTVSSSSSPRGVSDSESTSPVVVPLMQPVPRVSPPRSCLLDYPLCGEEFYDVLPISIYGSTYRPPSVPHECPPSLLSPSDRALEYAHEPHSSQPFRVFTSGGVISAPSPHRRNVYARPLAANMGTCTVSAHRAPMANYIYTY